MKKILILLTAYLLASCTAAEIATAYRTVKVMKVGYCSYAPNTQAVALAKIRETNPEWQPICENM